MLGFLGKFSVWLPRKYWDFYFFMAGFIWIFASCCHFLVFLWKGILDFLGEILNNLKIKNAIKKYRFILILVKDIKGPFGLNLLLLKLKTKN